MNTKEEFITALESDMFSPNEVADIAEETFGPPRAFPGEDTYSFLVRRGAWLCDQMKQLFTAHQMTMIARCTDDTLGDADWMVTEESDLNDLVRMIEKRMRADELADAEGGRL